MQLMNAVSLFHVGSIMLYTITIHTSTTKQKLLLILLGTETLVPKSIRNLCRTHIFAYKC